MAHPAEAHMRLAEHHTESLEAQLPAVPPSRRTARSDHLGLEHHQAGAPPARADRSR
jgi:hypothetical protein